jgi:hypothetical protein
MKTKEIDVWIQSSYLKADKYYYISECISEKPLNGYDLKAKLIIEIPEKIKKNT